MSNAIKKNGKTYWIDSEGNEILLKWIPKAEKDRDKLVENVFKKANKLQKQMIKVKEEVTKQVADYLQSVAGEYHEKWQGNATIYNFDKSLAVEVRISKMIAFDERLNVAKQKIDNVIKSLTEGANENLVKLVMNAFSVDKKGNVDVKQIISLKKYQFKNPEWKQAMEIIDESMRVDRTKRYIVFKFRDDPDSKWESVPLNFSAL